MRAGVVDTRLSAVRFATNRVRNELLTLGVRSEVAPGLILNAPAELARATRIASNYARDWLTSATRGAATKEAAAVANAAMRTRTVTIAATESSSAYNEGRASYLRRLPQQRVELFKAWDATLDKRTCPVCRAADGTIIGLRESFPLGNPGGVHPRCRCTETVLRGDEVGGEFLIQPVRLQLVPAA